MNPRPRRFDTIDEVMAYCAAWEARKESLDYEIDGVVVKVNDLDLQRELGVRRPGAPLGRGLQVPAHPGDHEAAEDRESTWGAPAASTPSPMLEPVRLTGVTIKLATLHNEEDIHRKDIRVGDTVLIQRAGEVIPQVVGPILTKRTGRLECPGSRRRAARPAARRW